VLGSRTTKPQLIRQVGAQRTSDEEQCLAIANWFTELPVRARERRRLPRLEQIRLVTTREQNRVPSVATQLAFQLTRSDRRHRSQRAKTEQVESFELLRV
jgi:hypothetical protein